jgi:hypothetical protein
MLPPGTRIGKELLFLHTDKPRLSIPSQAIRRHNNAISSLKAALHAMLIRLKHHDLPAQLIESIALAFHPDILFVCALRGHYAPENEAVVRFAKELYENLSITF